MRFLTFATLLAAANVVSANSIFDKLDKIYVGGGPVVIDTDFIDLNSTDGTVLNANFTTLELLGGYKYNGFLGAEARLGFGISGDTLVDDLGAEEDFSITYHGSLYWRPETANEVAKIYGLFGFSTGSIEVEDSTGTSSQSETGFSYGGGIGFTVAEEWNLNFEYRFILDNDDYEFTALGANLDYRF